MRAVFNIIMFAQCIAYASFHETSTLSQKERIKILREKIAEQIHSKTRNTEALDVEDSSVEIVDYQLKENEHLPITPIVSKTRALTTVKFDSKNGGNVQDTKENGAAGASKMNASLSHLRSEKTQKRIRNKRVRNKKPFEIFYRRGIYNEEMYGQHMEWVHCQDIVTPFLTGAKLNISNPKVLGPKDPTVLRLLSLLKVDTSSYGREDIYAILYQISNLNLRLFRWDVDSIKMLFNVIIKDRKHTFSSLKAGLRDLFSKWRLDFSNTTTLLKQSRIFRPPCIYVATADGSTKSPKSSKYPKKMELKSVTHCDEDYDEDC